MIQAIIYNVINTPPPPPSVWRPDIDNPGGDLPAGHAEKTRGPLSELWCLHQRPGEWLGIPDQASGVMLAEDDDPAPLSQPARPTQVGVARETQSACSAASQRRRREEHRFAPSPQRKQAQNREEPDGDVEYTYRARPDGSNGGSLRTWLLIATGIVLVVVIVGVAAFVMSKGSQDPKAPNAAPKTGGTMIRRD